MKSQNSFFLIIPKQQLLLFALFVALLIGCGAVSINRYAVIQKQIITLQEEQVLSDTASDQALAYAEAVRNADAISTWDSTLSQALVPYSNPFLLVASIEELAKEYNVTVRTDVVSPNSDNVSKVAVVPVSLIVNGSQANTLAFIQALNVSTLHLYVRKIELRPGTLLPENTTAGVVANIELDSYWYSI